MRETPGAGSASGSPTFLVGSERSGTTLLRLMLEHHPQVAWCHDLSFAVEPLGDGAEFPPMDAYLDWLSANRMFRDSGWTARPGLSYRELMDSFLEQERGDKPHVGAVVHARYDRLLRIWPEARFLHILRDGRDVARSCIGMGWNGNLWTAAGRWTAAESTWDRLAQQLPGDRRLTVRLNTGDPGVESTGSAQK